LIEYLSMLHTVREKLRLLEQKYCQSWFDTQIKMSVKENFSQWDDYIEWKAYVKTADELSKLTRSVRHGNFEIA